MRRPTSPPASPRRRARGFTLIELIMAMAAGLAVALGAFLLSKNATSFFQHEARISSAQLAATLGLNRIAVDLQRAAFHSSPNVVRERQNNGICGDPVTWPAGMKVLAGVNIQRQGSYVGHEAELFQSYAGGANNFRPDALVIGGSFDTTEEFHYSLLDCESGPGCVVYVDYLSASMGRTLERLNNAGETLSRIFRAGRVLRIKPSGQTKTMYGVIQGIGDPPTLPATSIPVFLQPVPALPKLGVDAPDCGVRAFNAGNDGVVNPVSRVRYDIRTLIGHPKYGNVVTPISPAVTGDNGRTELVRVELDAANGEMLDTLELVAEYAVDLKFGIATATESGTLGLRNPQIERYPMTPTNETTIYNVAADITDSNAKPERIRSVQVRLSTRTRAPDRDGDLPAGPDGRKLRFLLPDVPNPGAPPVYARLRTLYVDVALPNQAGVEW